MSTKLTGKQIIDGAIGNQHISDGTLNQGKINGLSDALSAKVSDTRTVNGYALSNDVTLDTDDISEGVGATNLWFTNARVGAVVDKTFIENLGISITESQISDLSHYTSSDFASDFSAKNTDSLTEGTTNLYFTNGRVETAVDGYLAAGTGVDVTGGVISIGQAVATDSNVTFGSLTVSGNLTVSGTTTTVNSNQVDIGDAILKLNADIPAGTAPSEDAGFEIARGSANNVKLYWDEATDVWKFERLESGIATASTIAYFEGFTAIDGLSYSSASGQFSISNGGISNAKLANSSVSVSGKSVSLGGNVALDSLSAGNGLTGTSFNGSSNSSFAVQPVSGGGIAVSASGVEVDTAAFIGKEILTAGGLPGSGNFTIETSNLTWSAGGQAKPLTAVYLNGVKLSINPTAGNALSSFDVAMNNGTGGKILLNIDLALVTQGDKIEVVFAKK